MDYGRLWWTLTDYSRMLTMVSTMASSDCCQWVKRTMTAVLLSLTVVDSMEVVLYEVSGETDTVFLSLSCTAKLQFVSDSDCAPHSQEKMALQAAKGMCPQKPTMTVSWYCSSFFPHLPLPLPPPSIIREMTISLLIKLAKSYHYGQELNMIIFWPTLMNHYPTLQFSYITTKVFPLFYSPLYKSWTIFNLSLLHYHRSVDILISPSRTYSL